MKTEVQPTYDDMLPSDLVALENADSHNTLALWYSRLNSGEWPEELTPSEPEFIGTHEEWKARAPDRRDDIMQWIKNKVGSKYQLMVYQCGPMMAKIAPELSPSEAAFERWWNAPRRGNPSITNGEEVLRHDEFWAKTREEWRAARKARVNRG